ncbi:hypothetical protein N3K66_000285 [Trichothecium roseum]|uniref:Uncharacterized protein n=1 Tax=Trichothecium roseum TaxID=47278 RepID=A0ACC0VCZ2_9HYPO|nr:hypothetical protein N3K66_000285 [Trichothecium roseum]
MGAAAPEPWKWPLQAEEYERYSRQMIVPNMGLKAQQKIKRARVLVVGAGGLGCPAAAYLAGAGVGALGLVDGDAVEVSNLHRQIAHSTARVGVAKVESAVAYLRELNPLVRYEPHPAHLTTANAERVVGAYDVVLDCTDHPASRYLVSDICVLLGKPLVSASAFQTSGQMLVLNAPPGEGGDEGSPCYRCVFPRPPPPESVVGCGEGGILGPVVGVMGVLQALEALRVITTGKGTKGMLLFGAAGGGGDAPLFRSVRMRGRRAGCFACGGGGDGKRLSLEEFRGSMDYARFCGVREPVRILGPGERVSAAEYQKAFVAAQGTVAAEAAATAAATVETAAAAAAAAGHVLLDVREKEQFELASIPGSVNVPISSFMRLRADNDDDEGPEWMSHLSGDGPVYLVCRVGNDSQVAARKLMDMGLGDDGRPIKDIAGGLRAWKSTVDPTFPFM